MRIKELYRILQEQKNGKVTQSDIARATGTSRANISKLFAKNSFINDDKIEKIEKYFGVNLKNIKSGLISVDYFPDKIVEDTDGRVKLSDRYVKTLMPSAIFSAEEEAQYIMCHANDDSMYPLILKGDFIIVKRLEKGSAIDNQIYLFVYKNNVYIKRLDKNINQIVAFSENKEYATQYISNDGMGNFHLIGKVVYIGRNLI